MRKNLHVWKRPILVQVNRTQRFCLLSVSLYVSLRSRRWSGKPMPQGKLLWGQAGQVHLESAEIVVFAGNSAEVFWKRLFFFYGSYLESWKVKNAENSLNWCKTIPFSNLFPVPIVFASNSFENASFCYVFASSYLDMRDKWFCINCIWKRRLCKWKRGTFKTK